MTAGGSFIPAIQTVDQPEFKRHQRHDMIEAEMAEQTDDPDAAADRLEAALERIARLAPGVRPFAAAEPPEADLTIQEITERLDDLIGRLRSALGMAATDPK